MFEIPNDPVASSAECREEQLFSREDDGNDRPLHGVVKPSFPARVWKTIVGFSKEVVGQLLSPTFWANMIKSALRDALSTIIYSFGGRMLSAGAEIGDAKYKQQRMDSTGPQNSAYAPQVPRSGPAQGFNQGFAPEPSFRGNEFMQPTPSSPRRNTPGGWN